MVDKTWIKVAVVEGDYADLCSLGLPLALSLQLQLPSTWLHMQFQVSFTLHHDYAYC